MQPFNYANPLDDFRSSSYNFILTVANTTEALRRMIDQAATAGGSPYLQAVSSAKLGDTVDLGNGESAYLLVDTRRYSQFSITNLEMAHIYGVGSPQNPTVPAAATKMRIVDTTGLSFFNFLMDVMRNKIQSTRASAFFMLAIIFNGHDDSTPQQTKTISTCFIPLNLISLGFEFSSSGSIYDIDFIETEGNPGMGMAQMVDLGDIQAVSSEGQTNTVGGVCQALEDRLNLRSLQFFQKYSNTALTAANSGQQTKFTSAGKLVQYMITVPEEWRNFKIDTASKSANVEQVFLASSAQASQQLNSQVDQAKASGDQAQIDAANKARDSYYSFSGHTSIPDALDIILKSSQQYLDLASTANAKAGKAVVAKIVVNVTSDASTYVVHFDIYPFSVPKPEPDKTANGSYVVQTGTTMQQRVLNNGQIRNLITYDYLFSGRNSQVLDFKVQFSPASAIGLDSDLDLGQQRFAENASTGQKPGSIKTTGQNKTFDFSPIIRPGEPIFIPMKTKDQQNNYAGLFTAEFKKAVAIDNIKSKQEHSKTTASLNFLGMMSSQITIRGNPNIIRKYADRNVRGGIAQHSTLISARSLQELAGTGQDISQRIFNSEVKTRVANAKDLYYKSYVKPRIDATLSQGATDPLLNGFDVAVGPLFVKVNVYAPNVDFLGNQNQGDMFTNKFFYTGAYMVGLITTTFSDAKFEHVMQLIPFDVDGSFSASVTSSQTQTPKKTA